MEVRPRAGLPFAVLDIHHIEGNNVNRDDHVTHNFLTRHRPHSPLIDILHVLLGYFFGGAGAPPAACRCPSSVARCTQTTGHWGHDATCGNRNSYVLRGRRYYLGREIGNLNPSCLIVVARRDNLINVFSLSSSQEYFFKLLQLPRKHTSMISFLGKDKNGISAALHAIR